MESEQTRSKTGGRGPGRWLADRRDWWLPCAGCFEFFRAPERAHWCPACVAEMKAEIAAEGEE